MKILNQLSFTYNFSFYTPSFQRLLHLLKKDIEVTHFLNPRVSFHILDSIAFNSFLLYSHLGAEHIILNHTWYKTCKLPRIAKTKQKILDNFENMHVFELDSK